MLLKTLAAGMKVIKLPIIGKPGTTAMFFFLNENGNKATSKSPIITVREVII
jgi:hypothetical protein